MIRWETDAAMTSTKHDPFPERCVLDYPERLPLLTQISLSELAFYFVMFYQIMGPSLGLAVGGVGVGFLMIAVLGIWFVEGGSSLACVIGQIYLPLSCAIGVMFICIFIHDETTSQPYLRDFGIWLPSLIVVQWLAGRKQFLVRFAFVTVLLGLAMTLFMNAFSGGGYQRVGLERGVGFANPNDLGYWYGFCTLYMTIAGFASRRNNIRVFCWSLAIVCLYLVTLTVSRAPVIALAVAVLVATRSLLKEGFLLIFALVAVVYGAIELGMFDSALQAYSLRGSEETGRLRVWPVVIEKILSSPFVGVGASHVVTVVPDGGSFTPHNGLLLIATASGIPMAALFIGHWVKAAKGALLTTRLNLRDSIFHLPLLTYAFLVMNSGNLVFMAPWAIVCLALPLSSSSQETEAHRTVSGNSIYSFLKPNHR
jgi:hypothetical protein